MDDFREKNEVNNYIPENESTITILSPGSAIVLICVLLVAILASNQYFEWKDTKIETQIDEAYAEAEKITAQAQREVTLIQDAFVDGLRQGIDAGINAGVYSAMEELTDGKGDLSKWDVDRVLKRAKLYSREGTNGK